MRMSNHARAESCRSWQASHNTTPKTAAECEMDRRCQQEGVPKGSQDQGASGPAMNDAETGTAEDCRTRQDQPAMTVVAPRMSPARRRGATRARPRCRCPAFRRYRIRGLLVLKSLWYPRWCMSRPTWPESARECTRWCRPRADERRPTVESDLGSEVATEMVVARGRRCPRRLPSRRPAEERMSPACSPQIDRQRPRRSDWSAW